MGAVVILPSETQHRSWHRSTSAPFHVSTKNHPCGWLFWKLSEKFTKQ